MVGENLVDRGGVVEAFVATGKREEERTIVGRDFFAKIPVGRVVFAL
jgi:hypothetical protein